MLWQVCCNGEHVAIKDDVPRKEVNLLAQAAVAAVADAHFVLESGSMALLIKGQVDICRPILLAVRAASVPQLWQALTL